MLVDPTRGLARLSLALVGSFAISHFQADTLKSFASASSTFPGGGT